MKKLILTVSVEEYSSEPDMEDPNSNPRVMERRKSSLIDHINRIREANLKRQILPLHESRESTNLKRAVSTSVVGSNRNLHTTCTISDSNSNFSNIKYSNDNLSISSKNGPSDFVKKGIQQPVAPLKSKTSDVNRNRKFRAKSIPKDLNSNSPIIKNSNDNLSISSKSISLDSVKEDHIQKPATPSKSKTSEVNSNSKFHKTCIPNNSNSNFSNIKHSNDNLSISSKNRPLDFVKKDIQQPAAPLKSKTSDVNRNHKFHATSIPNDLNSNSPNIKNSNDNLSIFSNSISSDSVKEDHMQQPAAPLKTKIISEKESVSQKKREKERMKFWTQSKSTKKKSKPTQTKQNTPKLSTSRKRALKSVEENSNQENKKSVLSEENLQSHNINQQIAIDVKKQLSDCKGPPPSLRDVIVLNWLHALSCPISKKSKVRKNNTTEESKVFPVQILKKPLNDSINQNTTGQNDSLRKVSDSFLENKKYKTDEKSKIMKKNRHSKGIKTRSQSTDSDKKAKISNKTPKPPDSESRKREKQEDISSTILHSKTEEQPKSTTSNESCRLQDVAMCVSDLGKLQIVLNLNSLSPDDAAILIWLDDLPKFPKVSDLSKQISTSPSTETPNATKSDSVIEIEDTVSPRPNIYFPSVTIFKNIVVDSKVGLKALNEDISNSIYYKRCNLSHIES